MIQPGSGEHLDLYRVEHRVHVMDTIPPQNEGDFFSLGLFHGGDQTENQHPSFTRESQWTQLDTQCDAKCPKK